MNKSIVMETYPVCSVKISKEGSKFQTIDEILEFFKNKIQEHPSSEFISIFDHYNHTKNIGGEISSDIQDAKNLIFCFGVKIPNPTSLALRPRSFGICELKESFSIEFMQAPNPNIQAIMENWVMELREIA
jgi:hypothetical protein